MGREGPETKLVNKMRDKGTGEYGERLLLDKNHGNEYAATGVSDFTGCLDGVYVAIEVKSPDSSQHKRKTLEASIAHALEHGPTVKQRLYVGKVLRAGGCAGFAATMEQFMEILAHAEYMAATPGAYCDGHNA